MGRDTEAYTLTGDSDADVSKWMDLLTGAAEWRFRTESVAIRQRIFSGGVRVSGKMAGPSDSLALTERERALLSYELAHEPFAASLSLSPLSPSASSLSLSLSLSLLRGGVEAASFSRTVRGVGVVFRVLTSQSASPLFVLLRLARRGDGGHLVREEEGDGEGLLAVHDVGCARCMGGWDCDDVAKAVRGYGDQGVGVTILFDREKAAKVAGADLHCHVTLLKGAGTPSCVSEGFVLDDVAAPPAVAAVCVCVRERGEREREREK